MALTFFSYLIQEQRHTLSRDNLILSFRHWRNVALQTIAIDPIDPILPIVLTRSTDTDICLPTALGLASNPQHRNHAAILHPLVAPTTMVPLLRPIHIHIHLHLHIHPPPLHLLAAFHQATLPFQA